VEEVLIGSHRHHLPAVVVGEYRYGLARSRQRGLLGEMLDLLISASVVLPIEIATTLHYADVRNELRHRGTPIPENSAAGAIGF
jgi:tRNA(fMet)-specific endonuclease VapC